MNGVMKPKSNLVLGLVFLLVCTGLRLLAEEPLTIGLVDVCSETTVSAPINYVRALVAAGHVPVVLPHVTNREEVARSVSRVDLVFLCGGADIETARYGEIRRKADKPDLRRDAFEWMVMDEAVRLKKPIFGVCRGEQVINVYFGGSLWQDLISEYPNAITHRQADGRCIHAVEIEPGSRLAAAVGTNRIDMVSWHHQGVKRLAPGFRIAARAPDGFIEAIEAVDLPVAGVQFHPECKYELDGDENALRIFGNLRLLTGR